MASSSQSPTQSPHLPMHMLHWSGTEKAIAKKAFNKALDLEFAEIMQETKKRAAEMDAPASLWQLEEYLFKRRKEIDRKYDYRYSQLPMVFGILIREGRLTLEDVQGLGQDKLRFVVGIAEM